MSPHSCMSGSNSWWDFSIYFQTCTAFQCTWINPRCPPASWDSTLFCFGPGMKRNRGGAAVRAATALCNCALNRVLPQCEVVTAVLFLTLLLLKQGRERHAPACTGFIKTPVVNRALFKTKKQPQGSGSHSPIKMFFLSIVLCYCNVCSICTFQTK